MILLQYVVNIKYNWVFVLRIYELLILILTNKVPQNVWPIKAIDEVIG